MEEKAYKKIVKWDAIYHQYIQDTPVKDIAKKENMSESGIYQGLRRNNKKLKRRPRHNPNIKAN